MVHAVKMVASVSKDPVLTTHVNVLLVGMVNIVKMKLTNVHRRHVKMVAYAWTNSQDMHVLVAWASLVATVKKPYLFVKTRHAKIMHSV